MSCIKMYPKILIDDLDLKEFRYSDYIGVKGVKIVVFLLYKNKDKEIELYKFYDRFDFTKKGLNKDGKQVLSKTSLLTRSVWKLIFNDVKRATDNILYQKQEQLLLPYKKDNEQKMSNSDAKELIKQRCKTKDDYNSFYRQSLGDNTYKDLCYKRKIYNKGKYMKISILDYAFDIYGCGDKLIKHLNKKS